ncbi:uncharacterized protein EV420DRAFT_1639377 [Desarmillaria tabescens]|uniref:Protein kinase domain-containing protein n=1 Tax=Armillaria tabescens TaxID=1929756 RepID=A0AA39NCZ6_ARMTA|nr:uncharacterized protein EV420DRAFT_1639377 [Desarmillaria tabescens]KAK0463223.1 hypothetical protein EV420DRAFT_1639377 [Desarmillaria tabescens]
MSAIFTLHIPIEINSQICPPNFVYSVDCQATDHFVFKQVPELSGSAKTGLTQHLTATDIIQIDECTTIYRAVSQDQGNFVLKFVLWKGEPVEIILAGMEAHEGSGHEYGIDALRKFTEPMNDLENEARNYDTLSVLQGAVIPKFYGCFRTETEARYIRNTRRMVTCIVLEDCGEHLKVDRLRDLDDDSLFYVFQQLGKMHMECQAHPNDLSPHNIVEREVDGKVEYRFVDLHDIEYHECHFEGQWDDEEGRMPEGGIGCDLLTSAADDAFFWTKIITIPSTYIGALPYDPEGLPPQFFIDKAIPRNARPAVGHSMLCHIFVDFFTRVYEEHQQQIEEGGESLSSEDVDASWHKAVDKYRQLWLEEGLPTTATEAANFLPAEVREYIFPGGF